MPPPILLSTLLLGLSTALFAAEDYLSQPPGSAGPELKAVPEFSSPRPWPPPVEPKPETKSESEPEPQSAPKSATKRKAAGKSKPSANEPIAPGDLAPPSPPPRPPPPSAEEPRAQRPDLPEPKPIAEKAPAPPAPSSPLPASAPALRLDPAGSKLPGGIGDSLPVAPGELIAPVEVQRPPSEAEAAAAAAADAQELRATLSAIRFKGNTVFDEATLQALVAGYLDRPVGLTEIYEAADAVSNFYILRGYSLAVVTVPAQKIANGEVTFQVLEGVIGKVQTENNFAYGTQHILRYLDAVKPGQIYTAGPLEESLQALNALPGLQTKAVLKPGDDPGTSDLLVEAKEKIFGATLSFDNFGRENTGALRGTFAGVYNNPFDLADQLQFVTLRSGTGQLEYYSGGYSLKPFASGPRLSLNYGEATFRVSGAPVDGASKNGRVNLDYSLLNTRRNKFNLGYGATRIISSVNLAGLPQPVTSITTYDLSGTYNRLGETGEATAVVLSMASNFRNNSVAACTGGGNPACRNQALKLDFNLQHLLPIPFVPRLDALVRLSAAYAPDPLPDSQQYSAGGSGNMRAFRSAEIRGDMGYASSVDLRYGFPFGPTSITARLFMDSAQVGNNSSVARGLPAHEAISDAGVGFDLSYTQHFLVRMDAAFALSDGFVPSDGTRRRDSRIYASTVLSY